MDRLFCLKIAMRFFILCLLVNERFSVPGESETPFWFFLRRRSRVLKPKQLGPLGHSLHHPTITVLHFVRFKDVVVVRIGPANHLARITITATGESAAREAATRKAAARISSTGKTAARKSTSGEPTAKSAETAAAVTAITAAISAPRAAIAPSISAPATRLSKAAISREKSGNQSSGNQQTLNREHERAPEEKMAAHGPILNSL
jgi:hypothetical protein